MRLLLLLYLFATPALAQQPNPREKKVRDDKTKMEADGFWIYNNLPKAFAEAKASGKPIIVALRCIPCEECVKLDDELVDKDPALRPLLEQFVRVRVVSTNGLDLKLFQYDTDQSFAVFLLNADGNIYGRFGTRSHRTNWVGDVSVSGLARAMEKTLDLHKDFANVKGSLVGKRGPAPLAEVPEKFPTLTKYGSALDYEGKVVQSCIHCHQIGDATKTWYRQKKQAMPDEVLFPYPHPKSLGITLDPKQCATVEKVEGRTDLQAGDKILTLNGQPILSIADVQWVLHNAPSTRNTVKAEVVRKSATVKVDVVLEDGWKQKSDISWRASTWGLRRMAQGGLLLEDPETKPAGTMALRVKHVGEFGNHAVAKKAGFLKGDLITAVDGKNDFKSESELLGYLLKNKKPGDKVTFQIQRDGKVLELVLPQQE